MLDHIPNENRFLFFYTNKRRSNELNSIIREKVRIICHFSRISTSDENLS